MHPPAARLLLSLAMVSTTDLTLGPACPAQVEEVWVARHGSTVDGRDQPNAIAVDDAGNVYVTGNSQLRYTTVKYDREGRELWTGTYVPETSVFGCPSALAVDASGNVHVASGLNDPYAVVKYDPQGRELWATRAPEGGITKAAKLATDGSGNVCVVGEPFVTIKYGADGEKLWAQRYRGPRGDGGVAYDVALDEAGNAYVTGSTPGGAALVKYSADGLLLWAAGPDEFSGASLGRALAVDGAGNAHVTAGASGQLGAEYLTLKFSADGSKLWDAHYRGPVGLGTNVEAIALDAGGNAYVTGSSLAGQAENTFVDFATVKYGPDGKELWSARYTGRRGASFDTAWSVAADSAGNAYVAGGSVSEVTTLKYSPEGTPLWSSHHDGKRCDYGLVGRVLAVDRDGNSCVTMEHDRDYVTLKQDPEGRVLWEARYNSRVPGYDVASSIAVDGGGNVHVAGVAGDGFAALKYDPDGREVWSARHAGPPSAFDTGASLALDAAGGVFVSGILGLEVATIKYGPLGELLWIARRAAAPGAGFLSEDALALDASGNAHVLVSSLSACGFEGCLAGEFTVAKLDPDGKELWARRFDTPGLVIDSAAAVAIGPGGALHVAGDSRPCRDTGAFVECAGGELIVVTYDPDGTLLWVARKEGVAGTSNAARAIAVGPGGDIYVASSAGGGFLTLAYSADGDELWEAGFTPESPFLGPSAVAVDLAGNALVAGLVGNAAGGLDYALLKYGAGGSELWRAYFDGPRFEEAIGWSPRPALDAEGNVYLAGRTGRSFTTLKCDAAGNLTWVAIRHGDPSGRESASAVALDGAGNVYVAGSLDSDFATVKYRQTPLQRFVRGDCNGDGATEGVTDAVFLLGYAFLGTSTPRCRAACDSDGDGELAGVTDAIHLLTYSFLGGPAPGPPFPGCGPEQPLDPRLGCGIGPEACR